MRGAKAKNKSVTGVSNTSFRPDIQGLRAIAVLLVVAYHAKLPIGAGFIGVDIFFVISGFVISSALLREHSKLGRINVLQFFVRRFKRLVPAQFILAIFVLGTSMLVLSPLGPLQQSALTAGASSLNIANIVIDLTTGDYFDAPAEINPLLHMWSLSVEEQFYFVFPFLLIIGFWLARRRLRNHIGLFALIATTGTLSFVFAVGENFFPAFIAESGFLGFYSPLPRIWEFLAGVLISLRPSVRISRLPLVAVDILGASGILAIIAGLALITPQDDLPGLKTLFPVLGAAALITSGAHSNSRIAKFLAIRPARIIGDLSYSLYLWHWPLIVFALAIWPQSTISPMIAAIIAVVPAMLSFRFIEQPFRTGKPQILRGLPLQIAVFSAIPLLAAIAIWIATERVWSAEINLFVEPPSVYEAGCHGPNKVGEDLAVCEWRNRPAGDTSRPIVLIGDSHAAHYAEGLIQAAETLERDLYVSTGSGCPFTPGLRVVYPNDKCENWNYLIQEWLDDAPPSIVILAGMDIYWLGEDFRLTALSPLDDIDTSNKLGAYEASLSLAVKNLESGGHEVVIVRDVPSWDGEHSWALLQCTAFQIATDCSMEMQLETFSAERETIWAAISGALEGTDAQIVDFIDDVCQNKTCSTGTYKNWKYRDSHHLSNDFSRSLSPKWIQILNTKGL